MMKTVLTLMTGRNAYLAWRFLRLVKQEPLTIDEEIENHIKTSQFVAPDELLLLAIRVNIQWLYTGYSNRLKHHIGNSLTVAAKVYRSI